MSDLDRQPSKPGGFSPGLFLLLFTPVALLIIGGAWYVGHERIEEEMSLTRSSEISNVVMAVRRLDDELHEPLLQLRTLANEEALRRGVETAGAEDLRGIEAVFSALIAYNDIYEKVRWIDETGQERVRVNNVAGKPVRLVTEQLQQRGDSYYVKESSGLKRGEVYISPMDLNVEYGKVEVPHKPMLRLITPINGRDGRQHGILVVNVAAQGLLDAFIGSLVEARDHAMLLNREGYWLKSPDGDAEWGFMFNRKDTLDSRNPAAWKAIADIPSGQVELDDGLWTWSTVYPLKVDDSRDTTHIPSWLVVTHLPQEQLAPIRQGAWTTVGIYMLTLLALYGVIAAWLTRAMVGRARAVGAAAKAQAEAAAARRVRQAQERFRLVVEGNTNGLLVADKTGQIVLVNSALARMFGYTTGELLEASLEILLPVSAKPAHPGFFNAYMANPAARPMGSGRELYGQRKDGSVFPIEISLSPFTENGEQFVDAFVADISERKHREMLHRRIEARLQLMMQTNPNGLLVVDDHGAIEMANPALERMFGYGPGELLNQSMERLVPKANQTQHVHLRQEYLRSPSIRTMGAGLDLQGMRKDGSLFPIEVSLASFSEDGKVFVQATVLDTSRRN
ncbi:MAG: PAS domain S-box protein [Gallionellaceae bacterium]|nr:PAS domain S-box protein [Gallionellaceae bacterium]